MEDAPAPDPGLVACLRRAGASLIGLLRTRVELFSVELQEEQLRALGLLTSLAIALAVGVAGFFVLVGMLAFFLWQKTGYAGVFALALGLLVGAAAMLAAIRRRVQRGPRPFATTIAEIGKDMECLRATE